MPRFTSNVLTSYLNFVCTLCLESMLSCPETCSFYSFERSYSRTLILLLLCSSGDVEVNPGPAVPSSTPTPQVLSFVDFCKRKSLGFMHVNIRSLLPKFVLLTALAHSANPDVLAMSKSWLRKTTKNPEISIANYNVFRQDRTAKGGGVAIYCKDSLHSSVLLSKSVPKQFELLLLKMYLSRNKSLIVATCYRPPSAPGHPTN